MVDPITRCRTKCAIREVIFVPHDEAAPHTNIAAWARLAGYDDFIDNVWLTLRPKIFHPPHIKDPCTEWMIVDHELVHFDQQKGRCVPIWAVRYGLSQQFRYRMEREAYLVDIYNGRETVNSAVDNMMRFHKITKVHPEAMRVWLNQALADPSS